jgi:putative flippase GtrA
MHPEIGRRVLRFSLTGVLNTSVHITIASLAIQLLEINHSIANGIAFITATLISYLINTKWSFSGVLHRKTLFRFAIVSLFGLFLAMALSGLIQHIGLSYWYGILAVVCVMPVSNFLLHHYWTYR